MVAALGKAVVKGVAKVGGEVVQQFAKESVQQASKVVADEGVQQVVKQTVPEFGEQIVKNTRPPSTDNWWRKVDQKIPNRADGKNLIGEISVKDIKAHDSATKGEGRQAFESIVEGLNSKDTVINEDAFASLSEYTNTLRGAYHIDDAANVQINTLRQAGGFEDVPTKPKAWNIFDEVTSEENATLYKELAEKNPKSFLEDGLAYQNQLQLQEEGSLYKYLEAQGNEVNAEFAAFLQTVDPETRAGYIDLLLDAADGDERAQSFLKRQFEGLKSERLPAEQITQRGAEGITPEDINLGKEATNVHQEAAAKAGQRTMGDKDLSALSTGPELATGDPRIYQLGTEARKIFAEYEQLLEGVDQPTLQWHHKFQKAVSTPYFQRAWELVKSGDATVEDIIAMHRYALEQGVGGGDRLSAIMMIERIPHTELHNFAKAAGLQPSQATVKGNKYDVTGKRTRRRPSTNSELKANSNRISKIGTIAELAEDFQRAVQDAMQVTEEGMMIQKAWNEIPVAERSRLAHFHNLRKVQTDLLRKNSRKKLSAEEIQTAESEYKRLDSIYKKIKNRILETLEENRSAQQPQEV